MTQAQESKIVWCPLSGCTVTCKQHMCGFWDVRACDCAVVSIAHELNDISTELVLLKVAVRQLG